MSELDAKDRRIAELEARVAELEEQVRQLLARLGRNSINSSLPPSRDGQEARNQRKRKGTSRRKRGGQKGHTKAERALLPVEYVDEVTEYVPTHCADCNAKLLGEDPAPERRQLTEIVKIEPRVVEARSHTLCCERCGSRTRAGFPEEYEHGAFGPNLWAAVCLLTGEYRMSKRNAQGLLRELLGVDVALGSISKIEARASKVLVSVQQEVLAHIRAAPSVNMDETSWTEGREKCWLWVAATPSAAYYEIAEDRGSDVVVSILGEDFGGVVCSDRAKAYLVITPENRQACWFHLGRNFQSKIELGGEAAKFGEQMRAFEGRLFNAERLHNAGEITRASYEHRMKLVRGEMHRALVAWSTYEVDGIAGMCRNLLDLEPGLWNFIDNPAVEPTNNRAERDIRHPVVWRRSSFGTDSPSGSRYVGRILTAVRTCKKQGRRTFEYLADLFSASIHASPLPRLILDSS